MTRIRGYKYRAYPNKKQREFFEKTFGCCRFVYNYYLEAKQQVWKEWHDTLRYSEMSRDISHDISTGHTTISSGKEAAILSSRARDQLKATAPSM